MIIFLLRRWRRWFTHIFILVGFSPFILFAKIFYASGEFLYAILSISVFFLYPVIMFLLYKNGMINAKVEINEESLTFFIKKSKYIVKWNEIKYIVYSKQSSGKFIGIFTGEFQHNYNTGAEYFVSWNLNLYEFLEGFIFFEYRQFALEEIKKYWQGEIIGI